MIELVAIVLFIAAVGLAITLTEGITKKYNLNQKGEDWAFGVLMWLFPFGGIVLLGLLIYALLK